MERSVGHAKNTPLKGLRFECLADAQTYLDRWEQNWADTRIHGTTKRQVAAMFAEEKPALLPLPAEPFRHYQFGDRRVNLDGCVEVEAAYYSAPPGWIGRDVKVQWDGRSVRVLDPRTGQLLREHLRQQRGSYRIPDEDRPAHMPRTTQQLLVRCAQLGTHAGTLTENMYREQGVVAIRRIQGLFGLARKHGAPQPSLGPTERCTPPGALVARGSRSASPSRTSAEVPAMTGLLWPAATPAENGAVLRRP